MLRLKKFLSFFLLLTLFSVAAITSCGKKAGDEAQDHPAGEHPSDSTKADSTEHPTEHPTDSTKN